MALHRSNVVTGVANASVRMVGRKSSMVSYAAILTSLLTYALLFVGWLGVASGCAVRAGGSTALTTDDLQSTSAELAEKLKSSEWLRNRTNDSTPVVIAVASVQNLSNDLISKGEQWYLITRVRDSLPISALRTDRNISFVIPAEQLQNVDPSATESRALVTPGGRRPTHEMTATFRSSRRAAGLNRTEGYDCEFRITDLTSGELAFVDTVGFKRTGYGRSYD